MPAAAPDTLSGMSIITPGIAMRRLAVDRLEELGKALDLIRTYGIEFECGLTSALRLACIELPRLPRGTLDINKLHAVVEDPAKRRRWKGTRFHAIARPGLNSVPASNRRDYSPIFIVEGVHATHPLLTWAQMARFLDRDELTALADSMMRRNQSDPHFTPEDFRTLIALLPNRFRGRSNCLWALEHMRENTDSSMETRLRLRLEQEPIPELSSLVINHKVTVNEEGAAMYLDMALPDLRIGIEYAGRHHAEQWSDDLTRQTTLTSASWELVTAHNDTLNDAAQWREFIVQLSSLILQQRQRLVAAGR